MKRLLLGMVLLLCLVFASLSLAQEDEPDTIIGVLAGLRVSPGIASAESNALYAGLPQSRLEDGGFVLGDPDAPVTVVEFADFLCTHCQTYEEITTRFVETYVVTGQARLEYRFFPIISETYSPLLAQVAECAGAQGQFWSARTLLFDLARQGEITPEIPQVVAQQLGLDAAALTTCIETAAQFVTDYRLGDGLGVDGTPAVMVRVGDSNPQWVQVQDRIFDGGGLPFELLELVVQSVQ